MPGKDTKTRYQGIFARHQEAVRDRARVAVVAASQATTAWFMTGRSSCHAKTKRMPTAEAARNARARPHGWMVERGEVPAYGNLRLREARERFVMAARDGKVLNKHGRRYKPRAIDDIEERLGLTRLSP